MLIYKRASPLFFKKHLLMNILPFPANKKCPLSRAFIFLRCKVLFIEMDPELFNGSEGLYLRIILSKTELLTYFFKT